MPATKVKKSQWIKLGIKKFSVDGIVGINVEQMAETLDCNRSSFYWHFKSKEKFLNEMIQYWFEDSIKPITVEVNKKQNASERLIKFMTLSFEDRTRKDLMYHLRKLSQIDSNVKELLDYLTSKRLAYISSLIQDLGYSKKEAKMKSEILFNFYLGWYEINKYKTTNCDEDIDYAISLIKNFIKLSK